MNEPICVLNYILLIRQVKNLKITDHLRQIELLMPFHIIVYECRLLKSMKRKYDNPHFQFLITRFSSLFYHDLHSAQNWPNTPG